jgi:maltooligosyltrehalose trehalohydrolase
MGEEYGETNPFLYFVSHRDPDLVEAVRRGRRDEFRRFAWAEEPPDPDAEQTFRRSKLDRTKLRLPEHRGVRQLYRELLRLRRDEPALADADRRHLDVTTDEDAKTLVLTRSWRDDEAVAVFNLSEAEADVKAAASSRLGRVLDSSEERFGGPGAVSPLELGRDRTAAVGLRPRSFALYTGRAA